MKRFSVLAVLVVAGMAIGPAAQAVTVDGYRAPGTHDPERIEREQAALSSWLEAEQVASGLAVPLRVEVAESELAAVEQGRCESCNQAASMLLVGVVKPLGAFVDLEDVAGVGAVAKRASGVRVWSGAVRSPGATALRVHFTDLWLPEGAELYVYNDAGEAFGPYVGRGPLGTGDFWSNTVTGDTALLQVRSSATGEQPLFTIADVGHHGSQFRWAEYRQRGTNKEFCSFNDTCVENASCYASNVVNTARDAVAHYTFVKRPWIYMCSGGLIADTAQSGTPYFLTANHCLSRDREAGTVETFFFFTTNCNGSCYSPSTAHTVGASIVATNSTSDYTLMRLNGSAPSGAAFLGFSTDAVAFTNGANLYRIHHPGGAPQSYSEHSVSTSAGQCSSWPRGAWIYSRDTYGATEGGSSGSPVVNAQGRIVGQLSGGCGTNVNDVCDNVNNATVDGAFANYYDDVASILGGGGGCTDDLDDDGYVSEACGGNDCDDTEYLANPGMSEICDDFIDNDCDGKTDSNDPDCGSGECIAQGEACSPTIPCCSGLCHPKKNTCK